MNRQDLRELVENAQCRVAAARFHATGRQQLRCVSPEAGRLLSGEE